MKKIFFPLTFIVLSSCTTTMSLQNARADLPPAKIEKDRIICIATVNDGTFNGKIYNGSGHFVLNSFASNLQPFASKIAIVDSKNYDEMAKQMNAKYIIRPTITHWEPRVAAWSGIPTRVEINVSVYDLAQNKPVAHTNLSIKGRRMTFVSQSAEELTNALVKKFITNIVE